MPKCGRTNAWHNHWIENQENTHTHTHTHNISLSLYPSLSLSVSHSLKPIFLCKGNLVFFSKLLSRYGTNFLHHIRVNKSFVSSMKLISERKTNFFFNILFKRTVRIYLKHLTVFWFAFDLHGLNIHFILH